MEAPQVFHKNNKQSNNNNNAYSSTAHSPFAPDPDAAAADHFVVEELFDFSNDDDDTDPDAAPGLGFFHSADSSAITLVESCNSSSFSGCEPISTLLEDSNLPDAQFSDQLCIPEDDLAELEWLSNFVEEPFSSEDIQKLELITGVKVKPDEPSQIRQPATTHGRNAAAIFNPEIVSVPAKARSKRSRAAPSNWNNSLLLALSPATSSSEPEIPAGPPPPPLKIRATPKVVAAKKRDSSEAGLSAAVEGRRCMHCATDKTPQWRTGPMGPKTLCNACGVRYKSGRLVPEYRPAASPTFVLTKHSNSHRKVLELRRQKEMVRSQQQPQQPLILDHHHHHHHQDMIFDSSNGDDYLIQQSMPHDYRQLL